VDRVERTQHAPVERPGGVEQRVVEPHEIDPLQDLAGTRRRPGPEVSNGPDHFRAREPAGDAQAMAPQQPSKRSGLRRRHHGLHERRRVEVEDAAGTGRHSALVLPGSSEAR